MRDEADGIGLALAKRGLKGKELFQKVRERIERLYPEEFGERPSPQRGGKVSEKPAAKSFENLPKDAQIACDKFIKMAGSKPRTVRQRIRLELKMEIPSFVGGKSEVKRSRLDPKTEADRIRASRKSFNGLEMKLSFLGEHPGWKRRWVNDENVPKG